MQRRRASRAVLVFVGASASSSLVAATLGGCGDDTEVIPPDASTVDATADHRADTAADSNVTPDASDAAAPTDAADAADAAPKPDAGTLAQFALAQATAVCGRLSSCCAQDAAAFDLQSCVSTVLVGGGIELNTSYLTASDGGAGLGITRGKVKLDPSLGSACLQSLANFNCAALGSKEWSAMLQNCFGALSGTVAIGATGCRDAVECVPGAYCAANADGGEGTCTALAEAGAPCGPTGNDMCAYRGYLGAQRCDLFKYNDAGGTKTCVPQQPNGSTCNFQWECANGTCAYATQKCDSLQIIADPGTCAAFKK